MARSGSNRVIRGGGWYNDAQNARSAYRNNNDPGNQNDDLGFRLVSTKNCQISAVFVIALPCSGFVQAITQSQGGESRPGRIKSGHGVW